MMKILMSLLLLANINLFAQCGYSDNKKELIFLVSDRYNHTINTDIQFPHNLQIEVCSFLSPEFNNLNQWQVNDSTLNDNLYSTIKFRYGLSKSIELQFSYNDLIISSNNVIKEFAKTNINLPYSFGFKYKLTQNDYNKTRCSFYGQLTVPKFISNQFSFFSPEFRFIISHSLNKRIKVTGNIGTLYWIANQRMTFLYAVTTNFKITKRINLFFEIYKNNTILASASLPNTRWLLGLNYYILSNLLIYNSMESGWTTGNMENSSRIDFGLTYRFPRYEFEDKHRKHYETYKKRKY